MDSATSNRTPTRKRFRRSAGNRHVRAEQREFIFSQFSHLLWSPRNQLPDRLLNCAYPAHAVRPVIDIAAEIDQASKNEQRTVESQGMRPGDHFQRDHAER